MTTQLSLMGMNCVKCRKAMGALSVPEGMTVEALAKMLRGLNVYPRCEECIQKDPTFQEFKSVDEMK